YFRFSPEQFYRFVFSNYTNEYGNLPIFALARCVTFRPQLRRASSVASASRRVSWSEALLRVNAAGVVLILVVGAGVRLFLAITPMSTGNIFYILYKPPPFKYMGSNFCAGALR
ncbi:hypothetical protein L9F63_011486, partial [Diploptera punctata]